MKIRHITDYLSSREIKLGKYPRRYCRSHTGDHIRVLESTSLLSKTITALSVFLATVSRNKMYIEQAATSQNFHDMYC